MAKQTAAEHQRRRYKPQDVRAVPGESPPASGTFFYYANYKLYNATHTEFRAAIPALRREDDFLDAFKRLGCYVEDLALEPVNHLSLGDPARLAARRRGIATPELWRMRPAVLRRSIYPRPWRGKPCLMPDACEPERMSQRALA
jgi:hypothetical protein